MRQVRDMSIMEIDITNACNHKCSNCTRFCGHHKKTFFMDFETFKRAVDSLEGYQGLISTIGGEPLLHPEYNRFAEYLRNVHGEIIKMDDGRCNAMVKDYLSFAKAQRWFAGAMNKGKGHLLFTSMPRNYYNSYEAVQDTVTDLWLNDHTNPSFHQPILVSRKDLGISDEEFAVLRDNCWLENFWSASITPKGAFFCEIAGTLDMLFDGPGGKKIEPGWWDKDISEFSDQFHWCDICGMALSTYSRNANDEIDDASQTLYDKLKAIDSPKLKKGHVNLFNPDNANEKDGVSIGADMGSVTANYLPDNDKRVGNAADNLKPQNIYIYANVDSEEDVDKLDKAIELCKNSGCGLFVVAERKYEEDVNGLLIDNSIDKKSLYIDDSGRSLGGKVNLVLGELKRQEWIIICDEKKYLPNSFKQDISEYFLNPGYLFELNFSQGKSVMFSGAATSIRKSGFDVIRECRSVDEFSELWGEKVCQLDDNYKDRPDMDIKYFRKQVWDNYEADVDFVNRLKEKLHSQGICEGKILLLQSAFVYHTLGIKKVLDNLGYEVYLISNEKFKPYFEDIIENDKVVYFDESHFRYDLQEKTRKIMKDKTSFVGAVVPFSFGPSTIKPIDDYTDALKTAEDVTGKILCTVNIRREFIEAEYDYWRE